MEDDKDGPAGASELRVPIAEERIGFSKREVTTGRVRISTKVETFDQIARADLTSEIVEVTRVPIDTPVAGPLPESGRRTM